MVDLSKQDRSMPRTPSDLDRMYNIGKRLAELEKAVADLQQRVKAVEEVVQSE